MPGRARDWHTATPPPSRPWGCPLSRRAPGQPYPSQSPSRSRRQTGHPRSGTSRARGVSRHIARSLPRVPPCPFLWFSGPFVAQRGGKGEDLLPYCRDGPQSGPFRPQPGACRMVRRGTNPIPTSLSGPRAAQRLVERGASGGCDYSTSGTRRRADESSHEGQKGLYSKCGEGIVRLVLAKSRRRLRAGAGGFREPALPGVGSRHLGPKNRDPKNEGWRSMCCAASFPVSGSQVGRSSVLGRVRRRLLLLPAVASKPDGRRPLVSAQ